MGLLVCYILITLFHIIKYIVNMYIICKDTFVISFRFDSYYCMCVYLKDICVTIIDINTFSSKKVCVNTIVCVIMHVFLFLFIHNLFVNACSKLFLCVHLCVLSAYYCLYTQCKL